MRYYIGMLEFPGQVLELSMPMGRGTKGPPRPLWVQAWTHNDYLNLRALLRVHFDIITLLDVVQRSFSYGLKTLRCLSRPTVRL